MRFDHRRTLVQHHDIANNSTAVGEICYIPVSPMRILVVEDDDKIASFVVNGLKQSGFAVDRAKDGEQGARLWVVDLLRRGGS